MFKVEDAALEAPQIIPAPLRVAVYRHGARSPAVYLDVQSFVLYPYRPAASEDADKGVKVRAEEHAEVIFAIMLPPEFQLTKTPAHVGTVQDAEVKAETKPEPIPEKRAGFVSQNPFA